MRRSWADAARFAVSFGALALLSGLTASACGSRTGLFVGGAGAGAVQSCQTTADCVVTDECVEVECIDTFCQEAGPIECPMVDPCTAGICDAARGGCVYEPITDDLDGDGFLGTLPGTIAGEPGSCGEDCDDTRALAFPGGTEVCDGVDNDCDGIVDNGSDYLAGTTIERDLRRLQSGALESSGGNDMVYGAGAFVASYWGRSGGTARPYIHGVDENGSDTFAERLVADINSTTFGADLAFSGMSFGAVMSDNRLGDYEVSFAHFDPLGQKLGPDVWLTSSPGFSTHERVIFDQGRFVAVWDDHREVADGGQPRLFGQFIDVDGVLIGENVPLSESGPRSEFPMIAALPKRFGLVHTVLAPDDTSAVNVRTFDKDFADGTSAELVPGGARAANITAVGSSFLVAWSVQDGTTPGPAIRGALVDERGGVLVPPQDLTSGATMAQSFGLLSLGDRVLLVWADDAADENYELYAKVIGLDLEDIEPRTRLTSGPYDSTSPYLAITETGSVGILFDDKRTGVKDAYFMTLGCELEGSPELPPDGTPCDCSRGCLPGGCPQCCVK